MSLQADLSALHSRLDDQCRQVTSLAAGPEASAAEVDSHLYEVERNLIQARRRLERILKTLGTG